MFLIALVLFLEVIFDIIGISFAVFEFISDHCLFFFTQIMFRETK